MGRPRDTVATFWTHVRKTTGCWFWTGSVNTITGYGRCRIDARTSTAHRLSYRLAYGPVPDGLSVCHHCDTRLCVRPDHLFVGTTADNLRDMVLKGRNALKQGECNPKARLSGMKVLKIRTLYRTGQYLQRQLATRFGVSQLTISNIVTRKTWRHLPE